MIELLSVLGVFKITTMLMEYDGPLDIIKTFRETIERFQTKRKVLNFDCFFCFSTVISLPFAIYLADGIEIIIYWFGIAGASLIVNSIFGRLES